MKALLFTALLILVIIGSIPAQQITTTGNTEYASYMKKSKKQKTAAWILLGGGAAVGMTGLLITGSELSNNWWDVITEDEKISPAGEILFYTGVAAMIGSIPLFIASTKNRTRAEKLQAFFKIRKFPIPGAFATKLIPYPSLTVTLKL